MTVYNITHCARVDNFGVVQVLEELTDIIVGSSVTVTQTGDTHLNGTHTVYSLTPYELLEVDTDGDLIFDWDVARPGQVIFESTGDDITRHAHAGSLTYAPTCTWVDSDMVTEFLGIAAATANDTAYIGTCVGAANAWAYRRRLNAGYFDQPGTSPSDAVTLGTTLYAAALYRERGSIDSFASFEQGSVPFGSLGRILQLLGCNRPQVG